MSLECKSKIGEFHYLRAYQSGLKVRIKKKAFLVAYFSELLHFPMALKMMYWALQTPPFEFWPGLCLRDWGLDWNENLKLLKAHTLRTISTQGATKAFNLNQVLKATVKMPIYAMFFLWMSFIWELYALTFLLVGVSEIRIPMIVYFLPSINLHSSHFVDTLFGYSLLSVQNRSQEKNQTKSIETINLYKENRSYGNVYN